MERERLYIDTDLHTFGYRSGRKCIYLMYVHAHPCTSLYLDTDATQLVLNPRLASRPYPNPQPNPNHRTARPIPTSYCEEGNIHTLRLISMKQPIVDAVWLQQVIGTLVASQPRHYS